MWLIIYWILLIIKLIEKGNNEVLHNVDDPKDSNGCVLWKKLTLDYLRKKIYETKFTFGNGYIIATFFSGFYIINILD